MELEPFDDWLARMSPDLLEPAPQDAAGALFYVGRSKSGNPYLAQAAVKSARFPAARTFEPGMDEGQIRLTKDQVRDYFKAKQTDKWRWRDLNRQYYELAASTDPGFRRRPDKHPFGAGYDNRYWVQTEGAAAGPSPRPPASLPRSPVRSWSSCP